MDKNFKYGIASVKFGDKTIGYIEKGSWDWGGTKPESTDVEAEHTLRTARRSWYGSPPAQGTVRSVQTALR